MLAGLGDPEPADGADGGTALARLVAIMDRLRRECPWDAEQTHESLAPYLLEETYEALDALEQRDAAALREELGDVLLQVLFHARVAAERTDGTGFDIDDVAEQIAAKLIRRHPHVFADVTVAGLLGRSVGRAEHRAPRERGQQPQRRTTHRAAPGRQLAHRGVVQGRELLLTDEPVGGHVGERSRRALAAAHGRPDTARRRT